MFYQIYNMPFHLVDTVRESHYELGSVLHIRIAPAMQCVRLKRGKEGPPEHSTSI